ncbi:hypothetical protein Tco_0018998 [Tanacetum coccineum]
MTTLQFADTYNLVAFLSKPAKSEGFEQIVDFLNANPIKYALTINHTIYTSCIEQFWATVKVKTVNREVQLQVLVDGKKIIVTEASVRHDLQLNDEEGLNTPRSDEDSLKLKELMEFCTKLKQRVLDLENTKTAQAQEIIKSSNEEGLGEEDASKQGRIADIDVDVGINLPVVEQVKPMKRLEQIRLDEELAFKLQDKEEEEEERAKIEADYQLAQRLQAQEQEELTDDEKTRLFIQFLEKEEHFALREAEREENIPPTMTQ